MMDWDYDDPPVPSVRSEPDDDLPALRAQLNNARGIIEKLEAELAAARNENVAHVAAADTICTRLDRTRKELDAANKLLEKATEFRVGLLYAKLCEENGMWHLSHSADGFFHMLAGICEWATPAAAVAAAENQSPMTKEEQ